MIYVKQVDTFTLFLIFEKICFEKLFFCCQPVNLLTNW